MMDLRKKKKKTLSEFIQELYWHCLKNTWYSMCAFFPAVHFTSANTASEQVIFPSEKLDSSVQGKRWNHIIVLFLTHPNTTWSKYSRIVQTFKEAVLFFMFVHATAIWKDTFYMKYPMLVVLHILHEISSNWWELSLMAHNESSMQIANNTSFTDS